MAIHLLLQIMFSVNLKKKKQRRKTNNTEPSQPKYRPLPYVPGLSEILKRKLALHGITVYFVTNPNLRTIFRTDNPKRPFLKTKNVVYKIPCGNCPKSYIGQTQRSIGTRLKEHKNMGKNKDFRYNIFNHCLKDNHIPDFENTEILKPTVGFWKSFL